MKNKSNYKELLDVLDGAQWLLNITYKLNTELTVCFQKDESSEGSVDYKIKIKGLQDDLEEFTLSRKGISEEEDREELSMHALKDLARKGACLIYERQLNKS